MSENQSGEVIKLSFLKRIFRVKKADELISNAKKNTLKKSLSALDLIMLGVGAIIGAGIFTLSGTAAVGTDGHGAGPALMLSFVISGLACILAALCYAEFAAMIPVSGSAYTYAQATLGEISAWIIGWALMLEYAIGCVTVACGWSGYLMVLLKGFDHVLPHWLTNPPLWLVYDYQTAALKYKMIHLNPAEHIPHIGFLSFSVNLPALFIVAVSTAFLYRGVKESTKMASIMVAIKMIVICLFLGVGAFYVKPHNWVPFMPNGFSSVVTGAFLVFFAFIGFDAVSTAAEETKNPQRDLPIGIITSLTVCTLLYIAVAGVLTGIIPWKNIDVHAPVAAAMKFINLDWAACLISVGAVAGLTSVLLVLQLGTTRILFAMSRDKLLPKVLSEVHPVYKTPHVITIIAGCLTAIGTIFLPINEAAQLCNIGTLFAFFFVCLGVLILRKKEPNRERAFKVPLSPFLPALGMLTCLFILAKGSTTMTRLFFLGWTSIGLIYYFSYGFRKTMEASE